MPTFNDAMGKAMDDGTETLFMSELVYEKNIMHEHEGYPPPGLAAGHPPLFLGIKIIVDSNMPENRIIFLSRTGDVSVMDLDEAPELNTTEIEW